MEQLPIADCLGVYGVYAEHAPREGARLVKHHRVRLGQRVHVVSALDKDALSRSPTDATKEGQRDG